MIFLRFWEHILRLHQDLEKVAWFQYIISGVVHPTVAVDQANKQNFIKNQLGKLRIFGGSDATNWLF